MGLNRLCPHEASTVLVAATDSGIITVKGQMIPGARAIRHKFFSYDDATVTDLRVKLVPERRPGRMGGDTYHTVRAVPTPNTSNRHVLPLGFDLAPGEDLNINLISAAGGTIRWRLEREAIRDATTPIDLDE